MCQVVSVVVCRIADVPCYGWYFAALYHQQAAAWWVCMQVTSEGPEFPKLVFVTIPFLVMPWDLPGTRRIMIDCRQEGKL